MKHLSRRARVGISALGTLALVGALAAAVVPTGLFASAAPASTIYHYTGHATKITRTSTSRTVHLDQHAPSSAPTKPGATMQGPAPHSPFHGKAGQTPTMSQLPHVSGTSLSGQSATGTSHAGYTVSQGGVAYHFNGLSNADSSAVSWATPAPNQALCVGPASVLQKDLASTSTDPSATAKLDSVSGTASVALEVVDNVWGVYSIGGTALVSPAQPNAELFNDWGVSSVRCNYDTATKTFFLSASSYYYDPTLNIGYPVTDVAVLSPIGWATYQMDTSFQGTCYPAGPEQGFDSHAYYLSVSEYCYSGGSGGARKYSGTGGGGEMGGFLFGFTKSQLVAGIADVSGMSWPALTVADIPVITLAPAFGSDSGIEYLVSSMSYDIYGDYVPVSKTLALWQVTNDQYIATPSETHMPTLSARIIGSEAYSPTMQVHSTGDGSQTCVGGTQPDCSDGTWVTSSPTLWSGDDSITSVQLVKVTTSTGYYYRLYTALDTTVAFTGDPTPRDGIAWFEIDPATYHKVTRQGYVALAGAYLMTPTLLRGRTGTFVLGFSFTRPASATLSGINPSAGYAYKTTTQTTIGSAHLVAAGSGPLMSDAYGSWDTYSAGAINPASGDVVMAQEYVYAGSSPLANWGTEVYDVKGY